MVKDEFDRIYTEAGASGMNATTNWDSTIYFVTVPANKLELWFWMESDLLLQPDWREFYSERTTSPAWPRPRPGRPGRDAPPRCSRTRQS